MTVEQQLLESYQFRLEQEKGMVFLREWATNLMDELICLSVLRDLFFVLELGKLMIDNISIQGKEKTKQLLTLGKTRISTRTVII